MRKNIRIRIFPDGQVQAEVNGIKGKRCTEYIRILEDILGAETIDSSYSPEYYEHEDLVLSEPVVQTNEIR